MNGNDATGAHHRTVHAVKMPSMHIMSLPQQHPQHTSGALTCTHRPARAPHPHTPRSPSPRPQRLQQADGIHLPACKASSMPVLGATHAPCAASDSGLRMSIATTTCAGSPAACLCQPPSNAGYPSSSGPRCSGTAAVIPRQYAPYHHHPSPLATAPGTQQRAMPRLLLLI
jgi:hypothetical protein